MADPTDKDFLRLVYGRAGAPAPHRAAAPAPARRRAPRRRRKGVWPLVWIALLALAYAVHYLGLPAQVADALNGAPASFDIAGRARVSDGDTIRIGETRIRLDGIDAPESDQSCTTRTPPIVTFACGSSAAGKLRALADGAVVRCVAHGTDTYGRTLATCYAGESDLGRAMVRAGWALAYRRYSARYGLEEAAARLEGLGLWATDFDTPEDWRRREGG
ncbi:MAG: thermonuclease family protein [Alphaproteobacteria bacterium]|nr:thermonuclease family protein [Alphaproteobacteria bacterium]